MISTQYFHLYKLFVYMDNSPRKISPTHSEKHISYLKMTADLILFYVHDNWTSCLTMVWEIEKKLYVKTRLGGSGLY